MTRVPIILRLEMQLNDKVIETVPLSSLQKETSFHDYLNNIKVELLKKHEPLISTSQTPVQFFLAGVPSRINSIVFF